VTPNENPEKTKREMVAKKARVATSGGGKGNQRSTRVILREEQWEAKKRPRGKGDGAGKEEDGRKKEIKKREGSKQLWSLKGRRGNTREKMLGTLRIREGGLTGTSEGGKREKNRSVNHIHGKLRGRG